MAFLPANGESDLRTTLKVVAMQAMKGAMAGHSPLDDPEAAAFAWARYRRIMRFMFLLTVGIVAIAMAMLWKFEDVSVHFYIATALGIGFTMLLASALMGLMFLSSGTGHDESVDSAMPDNRIDED